ncbi:ATPase, histidine kinase-, DNA gyrase B-, and HSP90-like domain protein [Verrucomicrobiia bacterium DG1235]|nr:ATPase, histidine kinase-, DNA gyrase B-, and HSP90-like domain protein [Verrucomicrobiae bacterium DG1235]
MTSGKEVKFVVIFDSQLRVLKMCKELQLLLGVEGSAAEPLDWQSLVVEDSPKYIPDESDKVLRKVGYLKCESGEILEASFACERFGPNSDLVYAEIVVTRSVPAADSAEQVDRESLDFLTTVSHELRVALNGVIGFANVLGGTTLDSDQHAILDKLQSCNNMLKGLINDILEYSRVATSKIDLRTETVSIDFFVREVVGLFRERARKKGLELRLEIGSDANVRALLPRMRITQVLSNLIANAIKFTEHGWVTVFVTCKDSSLRIGVQDTGPGVSEGDVDSIFRPFFQLGEQSKAPEGTGLGLAISKELVEKMGGNLQLHHPDEGGSLFEMVLPLRETGESEGGSTEAGSVLLEERGHRSEERAGEVKPKRILIVEDNQLNADILGHFLQDYGAEYDHVDNGRSAVEVYDDSKYDLILMDVMLPEMNGYEATEKILQQTRRKPPVPIVGVTAKVFRRDQVRCIEAGMVEVVHKPVDFKRLREVLDLYLYSKVGDRSIEMETPMFADEDVKALSLEDESDNIVSFVSETGRDSLDAAILEAYIDRMKTVDTSRGEIVGTAVGIVDAEVASLIDSIEGGDRKDIGMRAHSLKGALALLGARNILDLAKGLELIASDGRAPLKAEHWKDMIQGSYTEFKAQLDKYMQTTMVE